MSKLYNDARNPSKKTLGTGYGSKKKARETLKIVKTLPEVKQKQIVITMFNRAKYHKYRTKNMEEAMNIFSIWMKKHGIKHSKRKIADSKQKSKPKRALLCVLGALIGVFIGAFFVLLRSFRN